MIKSLCARNYSLFQKIEIPNLASCRTYPPWEATRTHQAKKPPDRHTNSPATIRHVSPSFAQTTTNSDCCGEVIHVDCRSMQSKKFAKKKFN